MKYLIIFNIEINFKIINLKYILDNLIKKSLFWKLMIKILPAIHYFISKK